MLELVPLLASIAQLAEQRFCKPQVVGSTPTGGSNGFIVAMVKQVCGMD